MGFEDTAGVRDVKSSQIEAEGIEMAKEAAASADLSAPEVVWAPP